MAATITEAPRRIMATSSLNEISPAQLVNRVVVRGVASVHPLPPLSTTGYPLFDYSRSPLILVAQSL